MRTLHSMSRYPDRYVCDTFASYRNMVYVRSYRHTLTHKSNSDAHSKNSMLSAAAQRWPTLSFVVELSSNARSVIVCFLAFSHAADADSRSHITIKSSLHVNAEPILSDVSVRINGVQITDGCVRTAQAITTHWHNLAYCRR